MVQNSVMLEKGVDNLSTFWRLNELTLSYWIKKRGLYVNYSDLLDYG